MEAHCMAGNDASGARLEDDDKVLSFVAFCLECYKARHGLSGRAAAELFQRHGVEKYLREEYDVLHSFGERQILDYVERFLEVRQGTGR